MKRLQRIAVLALLLAAAAGLFSGCATTNPDPKGWDTGQNFGDFSNPFPSRFNQGR
jgi:type IV pilus biogenesis protein CpaD/CtpE